MTRHTVSRRSFFGLLSAAPLAVPALVRAASEPVTAGADVQLDRIVVSAYRGWQEVIEQIRFEEAAAACLRFDQVMSLWPPRPSRPHRVDDGLDRTSAAPSTAS